MMITPVTSLTKFWLRCGFGVLVLLILTTGVNANDAVKLDATGRKIYEALLDSKPPTEVENDGTGFGLKLLRVSGHPRYDKPQSNGSIAEVIYDFKTPMGTNELRIDFLIYPDSKSANQKISDSLTKNSILMSGMSEGDMSIDFNFPASGTFEKEQPGAIAKNLYTEKSSVRFIYQIDRIIITCKTDASFPGVEIRDSDKLSKFADNEAKEMVNHAWLLLAVGKEVLDQPEIKVLLK